MNAEMQKAAPKKDRRFVYFGRMEKLALNKKGEEYVQWIHEGVVCVGYDFDEQGTCTIGVSFCSPEDSFSKKKARLIVGKRIEAGVCAEIPETEDKPLVEMTYEELVKAIESYIDGVVSVELPEQYTDKDLPILAGVRCPRWLC